MWCFIGAVNADDSIFSAHCRQTGRHEFSQEVYDVVHVYLCVMETDRMSQLLNRPSMLMRTSVIHYDYELSVTAVSQFHE